MLIFLKIIRVIIIISGFCLMILYGPIPCIPGYNEVVWIFMLGGYMVTLPIIISYMVKEYKDKDES